MKKLLTLTALSAILTAPALAVKQCVNTNLDNCYLYYEDGDDYSGMLWSVASDDEGCFSLSGVAIMISGDSSSIRGETPLQYVSDQTYQGFDIAVCACKLTHPYEGKYFVVPLAIKGNNSSEGYCAQNCAYSFMQNSTFRNLVLTSRF